MQCRGKPADLAEHLAIEQTLETRGYLRQQIGGWWFFIMQSRKRTGASH